MECIEARHLIDRGVTPGPQTPIRTQLGFHLAQCAACRKYRTRHDSLLLSLLEQSNAPREVRTPSRSPATSLQPTTLHAKNAVSDIAKSEKHRKGLLVRTLLAVGTMVLLLLAGGGIWFAGVVTRTQVNIAAMIVTTTVPHTSQPTPQMAAAGVNIAAAPLVNAPPTEANTASATVIPSVEPTVTLTATQPITALPTARSIVTATPWSSSEPVPSGTPLATATPERQPPPPGEPFTLLILGNDRRPGEAGIPRTDVVMLARIDPERGRVALLSFPRDLWVSIPGYGESRINAAYVWGETYGADGGGLGLAKATVSNLIGRPIDYVMMLDFEGFIGLIDSIGGVTVAVEKELDDPQFPTMDYGYTHAYFAPGPQHMDGITALTYSRIRHPDSDFARIRRQQAVAAAIGQRLQERGDLQNVASADAITGALRGYVQTDMGQETLLGAVWALRGSDAAQVEHYTLDGDGVSFGVGNDRYAEVPLPGAIEERVRQLYGE